MLEMNDKWVRDTGLIFSLIFLLYGARGHSWALVLCALILVALMLKQSLLWPLAYLWLKIAQTLSAVMNKVFFGLVFFLIITPISLVRRFISGDERDLAFHPTLASNMIERRGWVQKKQIEKPY